MSCLNCGVHLYIELPPNVVNFQCCQCYAVHKVIQPDPALAADENRKRKRKDRKGGGGYEPRELTGYNKFMRDELASLKESDPSLGHREAFKLATAKVPASPHIRYEAVLHSLRLKTCMCECVLACVYYLCSDH